MSEATHLSEGGVAPGSVVSLVHEECPVDQVEEDEGGGEGEAVGGDGEEGEGGDNVGSEGDGGGGEEEEGPADGGGGVLQGAGMMAKVLLDLGEATLGLDYS